MNSRHFARLRNLAETAEGQVVCGGAAAGEPNSCDLVELGQRAMGAPTG